MILRWIAAVPWIYGAAVGSYGISDARGAGEDGVPALRLSGSAGRRAANVRDGGRAGAGDVGDREPAGGEALKILCGAEPSRKITTVDVWSGEIRQLAQPGPSGGMSGVRAARVPVSERRAARAGQHVRSECGADP